MANITKTQSIAVLAHTAITHPDSVYGSAQSVTTALGVTIVMFHASVEAAANTNAGSFYVQISPSSSGDEDWATIAQFTATVSTANTEAMTATEPIGELVLACASTTGFVANDYIYIQHTTLANGEWAQIDKIVANTSVDLISGLTNEQTNTSVLWDDADIFTCQLDLTAVGRYRVLFKHEGAAGANCHVKAIAVTGDSIS